MLVVDHWPFDMFNFRYNVASIDVPKLWALNFAIFYYLSEEHRADISEIKTETLFNLESECK